MLTARPSHMTAGSHHGQQPRLLIHSPRARSLLPAFPKPATFRDVPPGVPSGWLAPQRSPGSVCSPSPETPKGARWRLPGLPARPANRNVFRLREFVRPNMVTEVGRDSPALSTYSSLQSQSIATSTKTDNGLARLDVRRANASGTGSSPPTYRDKYTCSEVRSTTPSPECTPLTLPRAAVNQPTDSKATYTEAAEKEGMHLPETHEGGPFLPTYPRHDNAGSAMRWEGRSPEGTPHPLTRRGVPVLNANETNPMVDLQTDKLQTETLTNRVPQ